MRLIKLLVVLVLAALIALVGYAYLGDMTPNQREIRDDIPVEGGELAPNPGATGSQTAPEADTDFDTGAAAETDATSQPEAEAAPEPIPAEDTSEAPGD